MKLKGGFPVGPDHRVHGEFTHNPSSLRLSMHAPNLQQIPRGNDSEVAKWVKECFVAPDGWAFWERDYSGIEAVLVGYFAGSPRYTRAASLGIHAFLAAVILGRPFDWGWSDVDIREAVKEIKASNPIIYDTAKRVVHGSNYMMTAAHMVDIYPETFRSVKDAKRLQDVYFDLFPEIRRWHTDTCDRVDGTKRRPADGGDDPHDPWTFGVCTVRNPFGYLHRFYNVKNWEKVDGTWYSSFGEDAKRLISFLPQSTAAAIIKQAAKRLYNRGDPIGESLRLLIHDSIFGEAREDHITLCLEVSKNIMEAPIPELPLDPSWQMGEFLSIGTEGKSGKSWATTKSVN